MPEMPSPMTSAVTAAGVDAAQRWLDGDDDFALGFECADPRLQIDWWGQEAQSAALEPASALHIR